MKHPLPPISASTLEVARSEALLHARLDPVNRFARWLGLAVVGGEYIPCDFVYACLIVNER